MDDQRYVSDELTHFLGASLPSDEERYKLLTQILLQDRFLAHPCYRHIVERENSQRLPYSLTSHAAQSLSGNDAYSGSYVCLCDIPVADLGIHVRKYKRFGLAFSKEFLVAQGASPVFYIAAKAQVWSGVERGQWYDRLQQNLKKVWECYAEMAKGELPVLLDSLLRNLDEVFSYLKFFDPSSSPGDPKHYYMEREWRVPRCVRFSLKCVRRVIIPEEYADRFREDVPAYRNQLTFAPPVNGPDCPSL